MEPLHHIDPGHPLEIYADASDYGMGYLLAQHDDNNRLLVIAHGSKKFTATQLRYDTFEKELMGIYSTIVHFKPYLLSRPFLVHTDHRNLTFLRRSSTGLRFDHSIFNLNSQAQLSSGLHSLCFI